MNMYTLKPHPTITPLVKEPCHVIAETIDIAVDTAATHLPYSRDMIHRYFTITEKRIRSSVFIEREERISIV